MKKETGSDIGVNPGDVGGICWTTGGEGSDSLRSRLHIHSPYQILESVICFTTMNLIFLKDLGKSIGKLNKDLLVFMDYGTCLTENIKHI